MNDGASGEGDITEGIDVIVCAARPAVRDHQRRDAVVQIAANAVPGLVFLKWRKTFSDVNHVVSPAGE